jgi:predicted nucleic acid-binding protein
VNEIIVDTGPLVAMLVQTDDRHEWAVERLRELSPPFITCEPVLAEVAHLVRRIHHGIDRFVDLLHSDLLRVDLDLMAERAAVGRLLRKYADRPMSLADACLVRLAELNERSAIFTTDGDFTVYRRHGRRTIPLITPN